MKITTFLLILIGLTVGLFAGLKEAQAGPQIYCDDPKAIDLAKSAEKGEEVEKADLIVVSKDRHKLYLLAQGKVINEYSVSFGSGFKGGAKVQEGDGRTPEGTYKIKFKNAQSKYHLSLLLSYPEKKDILRAKALGVHPGSSIMIHGLPGDFIDNLVPSVVQSIHTLVDWTQGCIAVTDHEIEEIYSLVQEQTTVQICPLSKARP